MLEDSDVLMITKEHLDELRKNINAVDIMIREIDKKGAVATQRRIHSSISLNAEERYSNLLNTYPNFLERFTQVMIASYLGITAETLSRIRKNLLKK
jgi:CRP/FNR family transcriptional regulator, anaerobic regulatory protein